MEAIMDPIGIHRSGSREFRNLELLAKELTRCSGKGYRYFVGNGYLDINTGKAYTTVMCTVNGRTIHCLGAELYMMTILAAKDKIIESIAEMFFQETDCIDYRYNEFLF